MMSGGKHLLLLAVFMSPKLKQIFSGDILYLTCNGTSGSETVIWYFNDMIQQPKNKIWKIAAAAPIHSGSYQCESNGKRSTKFEVKVLEYNPSASLTIKTGLNVMRFGTSVVLQLNNDDGLQGWKCKVFRGDKENRIVLKSDKKDMIIFQPKALTAPETIFWCTDSKENHRSNQQVILTTGTDVALQMYPLPAVFGESLTLTCHVWGTDQISRAVIYQENAVIVNSSNPKSPTFNIPKVTNSTQGRYKCDVTYTHIGRTAGPPYHKVSDMQEVFVQVSPIKAVLSVTNGLSCSCPMCTGEMSFRFYKYGQEWKQIESGNNFMKPKTSGTYACRAVMNNMRSLLSNAYVYQPEINPLSVIVGMATVAFIIGGVILVAVYYLKRRNNRDDAGPVYEDMPLRTQGDDQYELLNRGGGTVGVYDTLHTEAQGGMKKEDAYEELKKDGMKGDVYHTLGMEGGAGEGGYEALKKEGMKGDVYHTLGMEGGAGEGGYEALKKEGMKGDVYHTLGMEGGAAEGGYEALKKEGMKGGEYQTLGIIHATGEEEGSKATGKKDTDKDDKVVEEKKEMMAGN
ncbi:hypothetical protein PAMP_010473 [Pampus punctatissimus]